MGGWMDGGGELPSVSPGQMSILHGCRSTDPPRTMHTHQFGSPPLMRSGDSPSWDLGSNHHRLAWWGSETVTPSAEGTGGAAREEIVVWVEILTSGAALASAFSSWKASWAPWFPPACSLHKELEACCHISPGRSWNRSRMQPRLSEPGD